MVSEKKKCVASVYRPGSYGHSPCPWNGRLEHKGKRYCKRHHPPTVAAKNEAKYAAWEKEWDEKAKKRKRAERVAAAEEAVIAAARAWRHSYAEEREPCRAELCGAVEKLEAAEKRTP